MRETWGALLLAAAVSISGCATANVGTYKTDGSTEKISSAKSSHDDLAGVGIIDAHMHVDVIDIPEDHSRFPRKSLAEFEKEIKEAGIVAGVSHEWPDVPKLSNIPNFKFIRCIGIGDKVDLGKIEGRLKSGANRCIKVFLGYFYHYPTDKLYKPVYKLAEKYKVPVVFHTGDTIFPDGKVKYANPIFIDEIAVDHPKVNFVIAHIGLPWVETAAEVAYKNANVYVDVSALLVGDVSTMSEEKVVHGIIEPLRWAFTYIDNPAKMMFGADWPFANIKAYADVIKRAIPREHWKAVFHDNAAKVFGL